LVQSLGHRENKTDPMFYLMIVVGEDEKLANAVNVRSRDADEKARGKVLPLEDVIKQMQAQKSALDITSTIQ